MTDISRYDYFLGCVASGLIAKGDIGELDAKASKYAKQLMKISTLQRESEKREESDKKNQNRSAFLQKISADEKSFQEKDANSEAQQMQDRSGQGV